MDFALRLGDVSSTRLLLNVVTLTNPADSPISAAVSGRGRATVDKASIRVDELPDRGVWTVRIILSDLAAWSDYIYTVQQGSDEISGSFRTLPADQQTPFAFIVGTCDGSDPWNPTNTYRTIRRLVESSAVPVVHMFIIDDVHYADFYSVDDSTTGLISSGAPEITESGSDYAKAWTANYGLLPSEPKWMLPDRQWVYRNLPCCYSGGDHAIAGNWCRGIAGITTGDFMHKDCIRGPNSLEEIAGAEWDAFFGSINPAPLRTGQWYWGKDMGPVRMTLWDMSKTCEPYDARVPTDTPCYGGQQVADHMAYLDVSSHPFKVAFHESGITAVGQPWVDYHPTEAEAWLRDMQSRPNLNGEQGNLVVMYGDNHSAHTLKMDDFWAWSAGTIGDARAVGGRNFAKKKFRWGGVAKYVEASDKDIGDRFIHNLILVTVHADASPKYIEISHVDGGRGIKKYTARIDHKSAKNQMVES